MSYSGFVSDTHSEEIQRRLRLYSILMQHPEFLKAAKAFRESSDPDKLIMRDIYPLVSRIIKDHNRDMRTIEQIEFTKYFLDEAVGFGAIEELYRDPEVSEIFVEDFMNIVYTKQGEEDAGPSFFTSEEHLIEAINRMLAPLERRLDAETPEIEIILPDGVFIQAQLFSSDTGRAQVRIRRANALVSPRRSALRLVRDEN